MHDFGVDQDHIPLFYDNTSAINILKNPINHSQTKHIDIKHHFIRDHVQNGNIALEFVDTENQLADIFTKPLSEEKMYSILLCLGMVNNTQI